MSRARGTPLGWLTAAGGVGVSCPAIPSARVIMSFQAQLNSVLAFEDGAESSDKVCAFLGAAPWHVGRGCGACESGPRHLTGLAHRRRGGEGGVGFPAPRSQRQDDNVQAFTESRGMNVAFALAQQ